ncbi:MAG: isoprenylcysteine carboxylmethyltransferase family protein [Terriglobales bacterium]|jgi:protein-S-isoprenylcysteine O-methyltransferase Ste14
MHLAYKAAFYAILGCWFVFLVSFAVREHKPRARERKRDRTAVIGMALQFVSYFIVWYPPLFRQQFLPFAIHSPALPWIIAGFLIAMGAGSVWLVDAASRRLGKQWALAARVVEGHALIQDGPYRLVRNPIYLGMLGLLLATGLLLTRWLPLAIALALFVAGTRIRIRVEEGLLREAFGTHHDQYARRVPALIPGIHRKFSRRNAA